MLVMLYLQLNIFTILLCLLLLWNNHKAKNEVIGKKVFQHLLVETCAVVLLDSASWMLEGKTFEGATTLYFILLEIHLILQIVPCLTMLIYTQETGIKQSRLKRTIRLVPFAMGAAIVVINILIPFVFQLEADNHYKRLAGFYLVGAIPAIYLIWAFINCVISYQREKDESKTDYLQFIILLLFPMVGMTIQIFVYGMETIWMATTLGYIYIYINVQRKREQRLAQELSDKKVATMLGQIQYHFVFNTLATIENYCTSDSSYASELLECFQKYLRYNLESINRKQLVHFEEELQHTNHYLTLEKMRFEDHITVKYEIEENDFFLPVLTLQPVVEHAVRYGICKKDEPGTVIIQTKKKDDFIYLIIKDSGQAVDADSLDEFDTDQPELLGLVNVRKRIEGIQKGELLFYSRAGKGTTVSIRIPM